MKISNVYKDARENKFEPWCVTTKDEDGYVVVHRFEDQVTAENCRMKLKQLFG